MAGKFGIIVLAAFAAMLAGCEKPPAFLGRPIDGPYFLTSSLVNPAAGQSVCYRKWTGACDLRIAPPVFLLGWNEDFIAAGVHPVGDPDAVVYYYIVRDFDGPRADVARVVRGPFDEKKFIEERRKHGVPGVAEIRETSPAPPQS